MERIRKLLAACRERRRVRVAAAAVFLLAALALVQVLSQPEGPRFGSALAQYATGFWPLVGSAAVLGALWVSLWAATHRAKLAAAVLLVLWIPPAIANAAKLASLDLPLLPLDLYRAGDVASVFHAGLLRPGGWLKFVLLAALAAPLALSFAVMPSPKRRPRTRLAAGAAAAAFLASLFLPATNVFALAFPRQTWDARATCERNGFVVFLAMNCRVVRAEEPPGYGPEAVARIVAALPPSTAKISDLRPNVVVILSESFCDPTEIPGLAFDADPVPTLHQLQRDFGRLDLVSPVFGGLTCNAEFEVLTGLSMRAFPEPDAAWVDSATRPVPSLASILRGRGYRALALHAIGGMHNDVQVQPLLGFEKCIPAEEWAFRDRIDTWRVTDDAVTREIVRRSRELPRPWFLCVNTMEGHAPYDAAKYGGATGGIRFTKPFSPEAREMLTAYAVGLNRADRALAALLESFRDTKEPTLVFFYGDHRPQLGDNLLAWREAGLAEQGSSSLPMRTVPAALWNNFGKRLPEFGGPVAMSRVLPVLLDLAEIEKPAHVRVAEQADPEDSRLMQYDLLFGKRYFAR